MKPRNPLNKSLADLRNVRPGGGRQKHFHTMTPMLAAPANLTEAERELYEDIRLSSPAGLLGQLDRTLLSTFVQHAVLHERAVRELGALKELFIPSETMGPRTHPLAQIVATQAKTLVKLAESLGLTAATRQRLKLPVAQPDSFWTEMRNRTEPDPA